MAIGIDFGTTNTVVAYADATGVVVQRFQSQDTLVTNFNSVIFFPEDDSIGGGAVVGPAAMEAYFNHDACGRLLQSLKSFLTSSFESTRIGTKRYTLEDLIALIFRGVLAEIPSERISADKSIIVGRPVEFVNAETEEENRRAEERLRTACAQVGLTAVSFEYEPVAAAFSYEQGLNEDQLLLVGDFGGGTSDFTLIKVGPSASKLSNAERILGTSGIGVAGDAFDAAIVKNKIVRHLGSGARYNAQNGISLEIPHWIYSHVSNWHQLAMLKEAKNIKLLHDLSLLTKGNAKQGIEWLLVLIRENLSYFLYQNIAETKASLSSTESALFKFVRSPIDIIELIERSSFESWIVEPLVKIQHCVEEVLRQGGVTHADVHKVFLTGGSAFVPAVRRVFSSLFGSEKIAGGNEFTSVAAGLALKAYAASRV
jgi:hypothetical chaperone protein